MIDGIDIRDVSIESLRSQVGIVLQDTFIFSGTIRDNIRFGRLDATDEEIVKAATAVDAHDFIMNLPDGYDTEVQERGNVLVDGAAPAAVLCPGAARRSARPDSRRSDGQHRYGDRAEDPGSAQEAAARPDVVHRSRTVCRRSATRTDIVVLDHGQIVEQGNHDELIRQKARIQRTDRSAVSLFIGLILDFSTRNLHNGRKTHVGRECGNDIRAGLRDLPRRFFFLCMDRRFPLMPVKSCCSAPGELGKEVVIEVQRLGVETIAVDRYANAPAMQVAHRAHVIDMLDRDALRALIEAEQPDLIVPEIEAIATRRAGRARAGGLHASSRPRAPRG